jgi:hypothetical protein
MKGIRAKVLAEVVAEDGTKLLRLRETIWEELYSLFGMDLLKNHIGEDAYNDVVSPSQSEATMVIFTACLGLSQTGLDSGQREDILAGNDLQLSRLENLNIPWMRVMIPRVSL